MMHLKVVIPNIELTPVILMSVFAYHSGGKIIMKDSNGNEFSVT